MDYKTMATYISISVQNVIIGVYFAIIYQSALITMPKNARIYTGVNMHFFLMSHNHHVEIPFLTEMKTSIMKLFDRENA